MSDETLIRKHSNKVKELKYLDEEIEKLEERKFNLIKPYYVFFYKWYRFKGWGWMNDYDESETHLKEGVVFFRGHDSDGDFCEFEAPIEWFESLELFYGENDKRIVAREEKRKLDYQESEKTKDLAALKRLKDKYES